MIGGLLAWPPAAQAAPDLAGVARRIVAQTNELRADAGADATTRDPQLDAAAREFAEYMARTDRYAHDADGRSPAQRARAQQYAFCMVAENIAYQYSSAGFTTEELARGLVGGWAASPGHRRNMLDADATDTGVGLARSPASGRYYAVQMFGRPQRLQMRFRIENRASATVGYELGGEDFTLPPNVTRTHQNCRPGELKLHGPGAAGAVNWRPEDGGHYRIEPDGPGLRVTSLRGGEPGAGRR